jgi:hypothetical protein
LANVAHKNLTGADLHEPKGADAAAANKVYVSNGAGSGTWQKLTASQLETTGNPFGAQLFHILDSVTSGTASQTLTSSTWNTRRFQTTLTNEITSASLASNQITLPAGTYYLEGVLTTLLPATGAGVLSSKLRLRNITDGSTVTSILSLGDYRAASGSVLANLGFNVHSDISGRFTIAGTKVLEIQNWVNSTSFTGGTAISSGENEIYASVRIWKVA